MYTRNDTHTGFIPRTVQEYLEASAMDGVWVQGLHWLRAVARIFNVRVGVVIYGHEIIRFVGGEFSDTTIYLYKVTLLLPPPPHFTQCTLTQPPHFYPGRCRNAL